MFHEILFAIIRTIIAFILVVIITRIMGRKAVSQMTFFDLGVVITLGSITANIGIGGNHSFHVTVTVLLTMGLLGLVNGLLHIKSFRFGKLINSEPLVVIKDGQIIEKNMQRARITISELNSLLGDKGIFNIADVHYAIMESAGTLSVLPKAQKRPLTPMDMQIKTTENGLTRDVVINGTVMSENLNSSNMNEARLLQELKANGINDIKEVFYAAYSTSGSLYISKRHFDDTEKPGEHGIE